MAQEQLHHLQVALQSRRVKRATTSAATKALWAEEPKVLTSSSEAFQLVRSLTMVRFPFPAQRCKAVLPWQWRRSTCSSIWDMVWFKCLPRSFLTPFLDRNGSILCPKRR